MLLTFCGIFVSALAATRLECGGGQSPVGGFAETEGRRRRIQPEGSVTRQHGSAARQCQRFVRGQLRTHAMIQNDLTSRKKHTVSGWSW